MKRSCWSFHAAPLLGLLTSPAFLYAQATVNVTPVLGDISVGSEEVEVLASDPRTDWIFVHNAGSSALDYMFVNVKTHEKRLLVEPATLPVGTVVDLEIPASSWNPHSESLTVRSRSRINGGPWREWLIFNHLARQPLSTPNLVGNVLNEGEETELHLSPNGHHAVLPDRGGVTERDLVWVKTTGFSEVNNHASSTAPVNSESHFLGFLPNSAGFLVEIRNPDTDTPLQYLVSYFEQPPGRPFNTPLTNDPQFIPPVVSPDSRLVYLVDEGVERVLELEDASTHELFTSRPGDMADRFAQVQFSSDSEWVLLREQITGVPPLPPAGADLWVVSAQGGVPVRVNDALEEFDSVESFAVQPGGPVVVWRQADGLYGANVGAQRETPRRIALPQETLHRLDWSSSGSALLVETWLGQERRSLWAVNPITLRSRNFLTEFLNQEADGGLARQLSIGRELAWRVSPNQEAVVVWEQFTDLPAGTFTGRPVWMIDLRTGEKVLLAETVFINQEPAFTKSGVVFWGEGVASGD